MCEQGCESRVTHVWWIICNHNHGGSCMIKDVMNYAWSWVCWIMSDHNVTELIMADDVFRSLNSRSRSRSGMVGADVTP